MRFMASIAAFIFISVSAHRVVADEGFPPCIPLNEVLSICTNIEGVAVSFVDATPTAAAGIARLQGREDLLFTWVAYWEVGGSLDEFAKTQAQSVASDRPGYQLQKPTSVVVEGYSAVRYDLLPNIEDSQVLFPRSILFLDTVGGYAILNGSARAANINISDIHSGAESVARILKVQK